MRLLVSVLAATLTVVAFKITTDNIATSILPALVVFLISAACMVQNDLRDRINDLKKGREFAYKNHGRFRTYAFVLWFVTVLSLIKLLEINVGYTVLCLSMICLGLLYSETRKVPLLPNLIVSFVAASPLLFPIFNGYGKSALIWILFLATTMVVFGREILKDIEDRDADIGYKWTIVQRFGTKKAKQIAFGLFMTAFMLLIIKINAINLWATTAFLGIAFGNLFQMRTNAATKSKVWIDFSIISLLISLLVFSKPM